MKYLFILILFFFVNLFAKAQNMGSRVNEIDSVAWFEPGSSITVIEKGSKGYWSDSLSAVAKKLQSEILKKNAGKFPLSDSLPITDSSLSRRLMEEIHLLHHESLKNSKKLAGVKITPIIDSILTSINHRFALIVCNEGFTRTQENYKSQKEKNIGLDILTLGSVITTSYKSGSRVYVIIVYDQNKNVAFFSQFMDYNKEPLDENELDEQFQKILTAYAKAKK
jgi:hypothetical protein